MDNNKIYIGNYIINMMDKNQALKEFGLTDKESKVYLSLLSLGSVNLQELARRIDLPRTTIYNTINYLYTKGLVSRIVKGYVTYFEAVDPSKIIDNINQKKEIILSVLPELESLKKNIKESSSVEIYEGFKGISTILADVFKERQQTYYFGSYSKSVEILKHLPEHFRNLRIQKKIPAKIVIDHYDEETFHKKSYRKITQMRFLDSLKDFPCMIFIYGSKIAMYTVSGELIGIIIKNKEFSQAMKIVFNIYWGQAK